MRCTRNRGPRGFFCLQVDRRGPVNVAVITLVLTMAKFLIFAILILAAGCDNAPTAATVGRLPRTQNDGEFLVPRETLPENLVKLAEAIEQFPLKCSLEEFQFALGAAGLNKQSDWYKDFRHQWCLDSDLNKTVDHRLLTYRIYIENVYWGDRGVDLQRARIRRENHPGFEDATVWEVEYR